MKIIIIGSGRVGRALAEQLQNEKADITLIDVNERKINLVLEDVDAMGIIGNGASINILMEAGIESADILIAVTGSDELNLLCCLIAQKASKCQTIARVRNPIYGSEIGFIKERLGLSMFINPELSTAQEISRLLRFPSASKIDTFARGRVELLKFKVLPEFHLGGMTVSQIADKLKVEILFCAVEHNNEITIPNGNTVISEGDLVYIMATPKKAAEFFRKIGLKTTQVRNVMIVGGGTISYYLATLLQDMRIEIKIIEKDKARCEFLAERLPGVTIINGDGTDRDLLLEEGLPNAEALVALTDLDEENKTIRVNKQVRRSKNGMEVSTPKTQASIRTISISDECLRLLKGLKAKQPVGTKLMFPSPVTGTYYDLKSITYRLHRIQRRAGVPQIRFHDLRHSFATLSIEQGMDIKTISHMLGHTDAGFTMNTYMHVTDSMQQNVADTMGELLKSKKDENEEKIIKFPA